MIEATRETDQAPSNPGVADQLAVSVRAAAKRAGLGRTTIYDVIASGDLPTIKIGRRRLIRIATLDQWLESLEQRPAKKAAS